MHSTSDNITVTPYDDANEVVNEDINIKII